MGAGQILIQIQFNHPHRALSTAPRRELAQLLGSRDRGMSRPGVKLGIGRYAEDDGMHSRICSLGKRACGICGHCLVVSGWGNG